MDFADFAYFVSFAYFLDYELKNSGKATCYLRLLMIDSVGFVFVGPLVRLLE